LTGLQNEDQSGARYGTMINRGDVYMDFGYVWPALRSGRKVRLEGWLGYWAWENNTIMMHCANGDVIDIRNTNDVTYTFSNIALDRWEIVED
jgi:hypothetical protein